MDKPAPRFDLRRSVWVMWGTVPPLIGLILSAHKLVDETSFANVFLLLLYVLLALGASGGVAAGILWNTSTRRDAIWSTLQVFITYSVIWSLFAIALGDASLSNVWWRAALGLLYLPFVGYSLPSVTPLLLIGLVAAWSVVFWRDRIPHRNKGPTNV